MAEAPIDLATGKEVSFASQLELDPDPNKPGRYLVDVDPVWNCPVIPHGGMMASIAARAMADELSNHQDGREPMSLRSLTTVFVAPIPAGPVSIDVTILRHGRTMSQVRANVCAGTGSSTVGHTTTAVFGHGRPGFELDDLPMPDAPKPEDCPSWRDNPPEEVDFTPTHFPFWEMVEGRAAFGHAPWDDYVPESSDSGSWYRFDNPPLRDDGTYDPLTMVTFADTMPGAVAEMLGPDQPEWYPPSADLTVHLLGIPRSDWILSRKRLRRASDGYASVEIAMWDPTVGLVAHACQVMFFTFPDGAPTT